MRATKLQACLLGVCSFFLFLRAEKRNQAVGGLRFEHPIDDNQRRAYFSGHFEKMRALAPDLSQDKKRTQEAFSEALDWFASNYPIRPFGAAEDAYRRFRHRNLSLHMQTPDVRKFFLGVLGRIDDMILYQAMRAAAWRWRKSRAAWGHKGIPPIASTGDL